jgi:signal transduction histidine kinase
MPLPSMQYAICNMTMTSIRGRLILSYVALTLLTLVVVGFISILLVRYYVLDQQRRTLNENAQAVARQVATVMQQPLIPGGELQDIALSAAFLSGCQVRILSTNDQALADSGADVAMDTVVWILPDNLPPDFPIEQNGSIAGFVITTSSGGPPPGLYEDGVTKPRGYRYNPYQGAWGDSGYRPQADADQPATGAQPISFDGPTVRVPVGNQASPMGYVEVTGVATFSDEAVTTTARAFGIAGIGAVIIAAFVGLWTSRRLTAPLHALRLATDRMGEGDLTVRAPVQSQDEIGQVSHQFNRMAERLQASFNEIGTERDTLRRFIADASHELRTPITALKTFTELLQGVAATDSHAQADFLAESAAQVRRLEWITQNLLDLSRLDAGLIQLDLKPTQLDAFLNDVLAPFRPRAADHDITLALQTPEVPLTLNADAPRLQIALSNLVDNALKFATPASTITLAAEGSDSGRVALSVHNAGDPIPAEDLPLIFDRFYRGHNSPTGSGLGLAIAHAIVKAHGGDISVTSDTSGTTFTILL